MDNKKKNNNYTTKKKRGGRRMAVSIGVIPYIQGDAADNFLSDLDESTLDFELIDKCDELLEKLLKE